jgi:hypothetical protein
MFRTSGDENGDKYGKMLREKIRRASLDADELNVEDERRVGRDHWRVALCAVSVVGRAYQLRLLTH